MRRQWCSCIATVAAVLVLGISGCKPGQTPEVKSAHLIEITSAEQFKEVVLDSGELCLVDFYADWCGPCQRLAPVMHGLADELVGKVRVVKVNTDNLSALVAEYKVTSIPDIRIFVGGEQVDKVVGAEPAAEYRERLSRYSVPKP